MFIKKIKKTYPNTGKNYFSFELFESVETEKGVQKKRLLSLGTRLNLPEAQYQLLADCIEAISTRMTLLSSYPKEVEDLAAIYVPQLEKRNRNRMRGSYASLKAPRSRKSSALRMETQEPRSSVGPRRIGVPRGQALPFDDLKIRKAFTPHKEENSAPYRAPKRVSFGDSKARRAFAPRREEVFKDESEFKPSSASRKNAGSFDKRISSKPQRSFFPRREETSGEFQEPRKSFGPRRIGGLRGKTLPQGDRPRSLGPRKEQTFRVEEPKGIDFNKPRYSKFKKFSR
jgi:hypothetical protein